MVFRAVQTLLLCSLVLAGQNAGDRSKAADYPAHATLPDLDIGVEYLLHSIPTGMGFFFAKDFLVVEVAIFPRNGVVKTAPGQFSLRVNGKKLLAPASAGMVTASIKYPDWETRPAASVEVGDGDRSVILGSPASVPRFPGDRRVNRPTPPVASDPETAAGVDKPEQKPMDQVIAEAGLPEVRVDRPVKGCIYFSFEGKTKSIKKLELLYDGGDAKSQAIIPLI